MRYKLDKKLWQSFYGKAIYYAIKKDGSDVFAANGKFTSVIFLKCTIVLLIIL